MTAPIRVEQRLPTNPQAKACLKSYLDEISAIFGTVVEAGGDDDMLSPPHGLLLVALLDGQAVGCGGLTFHDPRPPEIKRVWVSPTARGRGVARLLMRELEQRAFEHGAMSVQLDTNSSLTGAMTMYRSMGYREIPRYNDNPHAHHWFEKEL